MKNIREITEDRTVKKQSCRMTPQEKEIHKEAGKYRRMTDQQLIDAINGLKRQTEKAVAERNAMAALAEEKEHEAEIANRAAVAAAEAMREKVEELSKRSKESRQTGGREAVRAFLDKLLEKTGTGNGIGRGTIFKLNKILESLPDEDFALESSRTAEV